MRKGSWILRPSTYLAGVLLRCTDVPVGGRRKFGGKAIPRGVQSSATFAHPQMALLAGIVVISVRMRTREWR